MISPGEKNYKYLIGYKYDDYKIKPLHIMLSKMSTFAKSYDGETLWMKFLIKDDDLLKKYNYIWNKVSNNTKKQFDCEPTYIKKILKTIIRSYNDEAIRFS